MSGAGHAREVEIARLSCALIRVCVLFSTPSTLPFAILKSLLVLADHCSHTLACKMAAGYLVIAPPLCVQDALHAYYTPIMHQTLLASEQDRRTPDFCHAQAYVLCGQKAGFIRNQSIDWLPACLRLATPA